MANQSNAMASYGASDIIVPPGFNEDVDLIIQTYAKDLSPSEMSLFAADAHARGLSIVKRQIYAAKYGGKMTIMVGIDGYRSQAESHPDYAGQDGPYWCGEDGVWKDVWLAKEPPVAAKVGIYRKGFQAPVSAVALWSEFNNPNNPSWKKLPTIMLAKCAEAQAIRKAFPDRLGGTYISEEMDQAAVIETTGRTVAPRAMPQQPTATISAPPADAAYNKAKKTLWYLARDTFGWDQETLDLVAQEKYGDHLADLDTQTLTELYMDLVGTSPEERQDLVARVGGADAREAS